MAKKKNKEAWQVVKANDFIQVTQNDLTKTQKKIMAYIFSTVHKDDKEFRRFDLTVNEMLQLMGATTAGENYKTVTSALDKLDEKKWWIAVDNGKAIERIRFFDTIKVSTTEISGTLSGSLKPFFLELKGKWTSYQLTDYLRLSSEYSMDLFEWLKMFENQRFVTKSINEVKEIMHADAETYKQFKRFNDLVLKKAIKEINEKTDIYVVCTPNKIPGSRSYGSLTFTIKPQNQPVAYGTYGNVFLKDEEMHAIIYEMHAKDLVDQLSRYKYLKKKTGKTGDFTTIKRWHKKRLEERAEAEKERQEQSTKVAPTPSWLDDYLKEHGIQQEKMNLFEE